MKLITTKHMIKFKFAVLDSCSFINETKMLNVTCPHCNFSFSQPNDIKPYSQTHKNKWMDRLLFYIDQHLKYLYKTERVKSIRLEIKEETRRTYNKVQTDKIEHKVQILPSWIVK